ncbi:MAG: CocE/NonD family hydrolase [Planctomycetota bacterium]|jgi:putative CocE/NonD family hydrolase
MHYAYVVADWRGFYGSRAAGQGVKRPQRGKDGYDLVEWIAGQAWSDGKVGTWGPSALGKVQFDTAAERPPHLVCCVPLVAAMGQAYEFYYCGGVYREAHVGMLDLLGYRASGPARAFHNPNAQVWKWVRQRTYRPQAIDVPMLFITGWWDHFPDAILENFADLRSRGGPRAKDHSRLLVGPWDHMFTGQAEQGDQKYPASAGAARDATMAFFDFWLRDKRDNRWNLMPFVRYFQTGESRWVNAASWPGVAVRTEVLHLHADGTLRKEEPGREPADRSYRYDPKSPTRTLGGANLPPLSSGPTDQSALLERKDVLAYSTGPLDGPLRIAGRMALHISFAVDRVDADFTVRVCDRQPDGRHLLVGDSIQRAKHAVGRPLTPGEDHTLTIQLPATAYTFQKLHALVLLISSSNHPRFERNPHTGEDRWDPKKKALDLKVTLHHDRARPCRIVLPIAEGDAEELIR